MPIVEFTEATPPEGATATAGPSGSHGRGGSHGRRVGRRKRARSPQADAFEEDVSPAARANVVATMNVAFDKDFELARMKETLDAVRQRNREDEAEAKRRIEEKEREIRKLRLAEGKEETEANQLRARAVHAERGRAASDKAKDAAKRELKERTEEHAKALAAVAKEKEALELSVAELRTEVTELTAKVGDHRAMRQAAEEERDDAETRATAANAAKVKAEERADQADNLVEELRAKLEQWDAWAKEAMPFVQAAATPNATAKEVLERMPAAAEEEDDFLSAGDEEDQDDVVREEPSE